MIRHSKILSALVFVSLFSTAAYCKDKPHVHAALLSEVKTVAPGQPFWLAVELQMDDHWHTYWKQPGDSGMATSIKWNLPSGFKAGAIEWPAPKKIVAAPLASYGYE